MKPFHKVQKHLKGCSFSANLTSNIVISEKVLVKNKNNGFKKINYKASVSVVSEVSSSFQFLCRIYSFQATCGKSFCAIFGHSFTCVFTAVQNNQSHHHKHSCSVAVPTPVGQWHMPSQTGSRIDVYGPQTETRKRVSFSCSCLNGQLFLLENHP